MNAEALMIGLMGDVMIGRNVDATISREGHSYVWGNMLNILQAADVNIANLETTLTTSERRDNKVFNFKAAPENVRCLLQPSITIVNLANNHILDFLEEGLFETLQQLKNAGILYVGAGVDRNEASKPVVMEKRGTRSGMLGFTDNEPVWEAGYDKPGTNYIDISDKEDRRRALTAIRELKDQVDIAIVSIHWGPNMRVEPSEEIISFAHEIIDEGADIIHGHSAHVFQGIELYKGKLILYDTGDFVDDYRVDPALRNDHSFYYMVTVSRLGVEHVELVPVLIDHCQVNEARGEEREWCMERVKQLSSGFGTKISKDGILSV